MISIARDLLVKLPQRLPEISHRATKTPREKERRRKT